ncbi:RNA pseudouridine synthase [Thraustotheca clavata]|uniref:RNA pseudouridine synthase n=1 Tax=Thraustotheca clavata TaxID=74557 RepID=A0A1V9ZK83_9STRA|nr:RNA pseudouridine synthase [Thraustotheca clavata]
MLASRIFRRCITIKSTRLTPEQIAEKTKYRNKVSTKAAANSVPIAPTNVMRLAKRLALSGVSSRREAEKIIQDGRVTVNGFVVNNVAHNVTLKDLVTVDEQPLMFKDERRVWIAHKLPGELVTTNDPQGRPTIMDRLKKMGMRNHVMAVGRLDFNTEGLLLLTNDGAYARELEHPKFEVQRTYRALVRGQVLPSKIAELQKGAVVDGVKYRPIEVKIESTKDKDSWLQVKLSEGKNREVRKALAHVRLIVKRLIRIEYGPYRLADLPKGYVLEVQPKALSN